MVCIRCTEADISVIGVDREGFVCHTCNFGRHSCRHVKFLKEHLDLCKEDLPDFLIDLITHHAEATNRISLTSWRNALSKQPIAVQSTPNQQKIYTFPNDFIQTEDGSYPLLAIDRNTCPRCSADLNTSLEWFETDTKLLLMFKMVQVDVTFRKCSNADCSEVYFYDGSEDGILNMGNFLVGYDVLRNYMFHFLHGNSCSLISYHTIWKCNLQSAGCDTDKFINYQQWRSAWHCFLGLLDIDYSETFCCKHCGKYPSVLLCDATTLGYRKSFSRTLAVTTDGNKERNNLLDGSSFHDRILICSKPTRTVLRQYIANEAFTAEMRAELLSALGTNAPYFKAFLLWLESIYGNRSSFPLSVIHLLKCSSSDSAVISYFPHDEEFMHIMDDLCDGQSLKNNPEIMRKLELLSPIVYKFVQALPNGYLERPCVELFLKMKDIVLSSFKEPHDLSQNVSTESSPLSYFPCWPPCNNRGIYVADRNQVIAVKDATQCTKVHRGHPKLMPGLFTVYCEHDVCYGFQVMETQESPNVPFSILRTRFPKAPTTIIYDNCCRLHNYALNRDPGFFKECMFLIDRFHWKNHTACAESYNLQHYAQFRDVNSQINEQRNSSLKRLKSQLSYMTKDNFISHCKLFFWHRNRGPNIK